MGIVHHAGHLVVGTAHELHAAGHTAGRQTCGDMLVRDAEELGAGDGHERVLHVEEPREVDGDRELPGLVGRGGNLGA